MFARSVDDLDTLVAVDVLLDGLRPLPDVEVTGAAGHHRAASVLTVELGGMPNTCT